MSIFYFAYGNNMLEAVIKETCLDDDMIGAAKLVGHRLSFSNSSTESRIGIATIIPAPGMSVWGVLYEISEADSQALDIKQEVGTLYERYQCDVVLKGKKSYNEVYTYRLMTDPPQEQQPTGKYLQTIIQGAESRRLPKGYIAFLKTLQSQENLRWSQKGYLVSKTAKRTNAKGMYILSVSRAVKKDLKLGSLAIVSYNERFCLVKVTCPAEFKSNTTCCLDKTIRTQLHLPGYDCYGVAITIFQVRSRLKEFPFVHPRSLMLQPNWLSDQELEQNIGVINSRNLSLLGIKEGEYIDVYSIEFNKEKHSFSTINLTLRTLCGATNKFVGDPTEYEEFEEKSARLLDKDYPLINQIYLDREARLKLQLLVENPNENAFPLLVRPGVYRLFYSYLLFYGVTFFLIISVNLTIISRIQSTINLFPHADLLLAIIAAAMITFLFCVIDMRGKVEY